MYNYFVTFGWGHVHKVNGILLDNDSVAVFKVNSEEEGAKKNKRTIWAQVQS